MTRLLIAAGAALLAGATTFAIAQPTDFAGMPTTRAAALATLRARFTAIDANKDGFVTRDELPMPTGMPIARRGSPAMVFDAMDTDHNGQISRAEFDAFQTRGPGPGMATGAGMMPGGPGMRPPGALGLGMLFDRVDTNSDGKLSTTEAEAAALTRFDRIDDNHDGTISPEERQAHAPRRMAMRWRQDRGDMPPPAPPAPPQ